MNHSYKLHFSRFLTAVPGRLHIAAHSHHPWPNVSFDAQGQAWLDAAELIDQKWDKVFGTVLPQAQAHVAQHLHLSDPKTICFAGNTHELFMRLLSCIKASPMRVLTTDGEFHSFNRQLQRFEEEGLATAERVPVEPFASFSERFATAAAKGGHDLAYFSQCFFNSGYVINDMGALVGAVKNPDTLVVIDGYHGYMAMHTDLSAIETRAFYLSGGYKYAMCGEGVGFMHCPPAYAPRPVDTGWFAGFAALSKDQRTISYFDGGMRFMGATYDPTGLYRLNAVMDWLHEQKLTPARIHARVAALQDLFLDSLAKLSLPALSVSDLIPERGQPRGNFLTFRTPRAGELYQKLKDNKVITDYREDRLRIGFGIYHDEGDLPELVQRIAIALG